ncbi:MAG: ubiquinone biosynthesis protein UbiA, partial [Flavobacteriaceae bacterium]
MKYYFYLASIVLIFLGFYLWKSKETKQYRMIHNVLKVLLLIGVFSLILIDTSLIIEKVLDKLN